MVREIKQAQENLIFMEIHMVTVTTALQMSNQKMDLLILLFHSISNSLNTSESVLLSAILDPPAEPLVSHEKAYPVFTGPVRQNNTAKAIHCGLHRILLRRRQVALPQTIMQDAVWKAMSFKRAAATRRDLQTIRLRLTSDWQYQLANIWWYATGWTPIAYVLSNMNESLAQLEHSQFADAFIIKEPPLTE